MRIPRFDPHSLAPLLLAGLLCLADAATARDGRFRAEYLATENEQYLAWEQELRQERLLEDLAKDLNQVVRIPRDVTLSFGECGQPNAFYDSEARRVTLCYELLESFHERFGDETEDPEELENAVAGATVFVLFHELGHALVDVLDLPVTGREEDAVDQLAAYVLIDGSDEGAQSALDAAWSFYFNTEEGASEIDASAFWDEHSMNAQRFYNLMCWVYGADPDGHQHLVDEELLPPERAARCPDEWAQLDRAWTQLLGPHIKEKDAAESEIPSGGGARKKKYGG